MRKLQLIITTVAACFITTASAQAQMNVYDSASADLPVMNNSQHISVAQVSQRNNLIIITMTRVDMRPESISYDFDNYPLGKNDIKDSLYVPAGLKRIPTGDGAFERFWNERQQARITQHQLDKLWSNGQKFTRTSNAGFRVNIASVDYVTYRDWLK